MSLSEEEANNFPSFTKSLLVSRLLSKLVTFPLLVLTLVTTILFKHCNYYYPVCVLICYESYILLKSCLSFTLPFYL